MEKRFKKEIASLEKVFEFITEFVNKYGINDSAAFSANFAVEEIFTNMVKYNPETANDILVTLQKKNEDLIISLTDFDVKKFNVTTSPDVDIDQPLAERKVGGLGLHLVKKMVDEVSYQYKNKNSTITLVKHLEK